MFTALSPIFLSVLVACDRAPPPQSTPVTRPESVTVSFGPDDPNHPEYIKEVELSEKFPAIAALSEMRQQAVVGSTNLVPAPCVPCWDDTTTLGGCAARAPEGCENLPGLIARAVRIGAGLKDPVMEYRQIVAAISFDEPWYSDPTATLTPDNVDVEVWVDPDSPAVARVLERIDEVRVAVDVIPIRVHLRAFGKGESARTFAAAIAAGKGEAWLKAYLEKKTPALASAAVGIAGEGEIALAVIRTKNVQTTPTWFVEGYRLRGLQSASAITRLVTLEYDDGLTPQQ